MRMHIKPLKDGTTEVDIKLLPDGRTLIHWLKEGGPIVIQGHPELCKITGQSVDGNFTLACNPTQTTVSSQKRGNVRFMCITTNDPKAATCPRCLAIAGE